MKKYAPVFIVLIAMLFVSKNVTSQTKFGYISSQDMIKAMPEYRHADSALADYQDALNQQYQILVQEFNKRDSLMKLDAGYSKAKLEIMNNERHYLQQKIAGYQEEAQQVYQKKQDELMAPIYNKVRAAIAAVAKENGYTYIFVKEQLLAFPPGDDVEPLVRKKLGLK